MALAQLTVDQPYLRIDSFLDLSSAVANPQSKTTGESTLHSLNRMELVLIVVLAFHPLHHAMLQLACGGQAMSKLRRRNIDSCNFERVYDEYTSWVGRNNFDASGRACHQASSVVDRKETKTTVLISWERLLQQDLVGWVIDINAVTSRDLRNEYRMAKLLVSEVKIWSVLHPVPQPVQMLWWPCGQVDVEWLVAQHTDSNDELRRWNRAVVAGLA